jgi:Ca2+-transporting ATPase
MKSGQIDELKGLSDEDASARLQTNGHNEIPSPDRRGIFKIAKEVIKEPMFLLLILSGAMYFFLGDLEEGMMLMLFVVFVMGITFYQERKTERALEALKDMSSPRALVVRSGRQLRIAGRDVVPEDIILLQEGDRVPADAFVLSSSNLLVDESLLTGECMPVRKNSWDSNSSMGRPGGDDLPFVYSGTLIVQGHGIARVKSTGPNTEIGKIGSALKSLETQNTPLQDEMGILVRNFAMVGLVFCILVVVVYGLTQGNWLKGILAGLTLAMAALPEEIPVVLTIFFALGAWRISQQRVLTRRLQSIEALGAATVLCVDKTGTLTMNQMTLSKIFSDGDFYTIDGSPEIPEKFHPLMEYSVLASQKDPFDPMEKGIRDIGERVLSNTEHLHANWSLVREYALSRTLLSLSHVWSSPDGKDYVIAAKGAPEAIADLCHMDAEETRRLLEHITRMADEGLRVLGVAKARFNQDNLPENQHDFPFEFVGLIGFRDPVRSGINESIRECYGAGIRVVMITGDYPGTARNVGKQVGLHPMDRIITGPELDAMSDQDLRGCIGTVNVFARVVPEQKLRIVQALKDNGEVVAMTGDGVNDAPALKAAHIGIAMGARGSDVARESASLVLLDDDFLSIVSAVRLGRRIFDNLKKAIAYILAVHVPIVGMSIIPVVFKWPLALMPAHIAFLELIIDPACSTVFEAESAEEGVMRKKPRRMDAPLFSNRSILLSLMQGLVVLVFVIAVYVLMQPWAGNPDKARTMAFTTLVIGNLSLILLNRSWSRTIVETLAASNTALTRVSALSLLCLGLVLYIPFLQSLFGFANLNPLEFMICVVAGVAGIIWFELLKVLNRLAGNRLLTN